MTATAPYRLWQVGVVGLAALVGLIAVISPVLAIGLSLAVAFGVLMLTDIRVGACVFAFSSVLLDGVEAGIAADKLVAGALVLSWVASLAMRKDLRGEIASNTPVFLAILVLLAAWYVATTAWAENPGEAQYELIRLGPNFLLIPIIVSAVGDANTLRWLFAALLLGVLVSLAYGQMVPPIDPNAEGRLTGYGLDANSTALWAMVASALAYGILASSVTTPVRALVGLGVLISAVAILATGSRGGLLDLTTTLLVAPLVFRRGHRAAALTLAVVIALGAVAYFTTFAPPEVAQRIGADADGGSGRTSIWKVGVRMVKAHPIGGVGGGNFDESSVHYLLEPGRILDTQYIVDIPKAAHNTYLQVVAETGIVGGALFFTLLILCVVYALRAVREFTAAGDRDLEVAARGLLLAYAGVAIGILTISVDTAKPTWLLISLGPVMMKLVKRHRRSVGPDRVPETPQRHRPVPGA